MTVSIADLLAESSFRAAGRIDGTVPDEFGIYTIRLRGGSSLPDPFDALLNARGTRLIYIGKATSLKKRMLGNELRGRGHGTFFRSLGAVLGYRPMAGSLATKANKYNFSFEKPNRVQIVDWINDHLEVSWSVVPALDVRATEAALILAQTPLLNLDGNPLALAELDDLRVLCRRIASGPASAL